MSYNHISNSYDCECWSSAPSCQGHGDETPAFSPSRPCVLPAPSPRIDPNRIARALSKSEAQKICDAPLNVSADLSQRIRRADSGVMLVAAQVDDVASNLQTIAEDVDQRVSVLETGELVSSKCFATTPNGGGMLVVSENGEIEVDADGIETIKPATLELLQYNAEGTVGASLMLDTVAVTTDNLVVNGVLQTGSLVDTEHEIVELKDKVFKLEIADYVSTGIEVAQWAAIAANAAASFIKPPSYTELPDTGLPEESDPFGTSVKPLTLVAAGQYAGLDELGAITQNIIPRGKVGLNNTFPLRSLDIVGDLRIVPGDNDDICDLQPLCRLGSSVQQTNAQLNITNPTAPCVYLGKNALIDVSGTYQGTAVNVESIATDSVTTARVNGLATNRLIQRYAPTIDAQLNKRVAKVSNNALAARRAIKPTLSKSYDDDVARIHSELLSLKRGAYTKSAVLTKSYDEDVARIHSEVLSLKRDAYTKPVLTKSYDEPIVALSTDTLALKRGLYAKQTALPARDNTRQLNAVRDSLTTVKTYTAPISTSKAAALRVVGSLSVSADTTLGGKLIQSGALQLPSAGLTGTRLRLQGTPTTVETPCHSLGVSTGFMWYNAPTAVEHGFFVGGVQGLGITANTLKTINIACGGSLTVSGVSNIAALSATTITAATSVSAPNITSLQGNVSTLQGNVTTLTSNAIDLQSNVTTLTGNVSTLQSNVTNLQSNVTNLQSNVTTLAGNVSNLQSTVSDPRKYVKPTLSKDATRVAAALYNRDRSYNVYSWAPPTGISSSSWWIELGSFTTNFTGTVTFKLVTPLDMSYCDSVTLEIAYTQSTTGVGLLSAKRSGNAVTNLQTGCTLAGITNLTNAAAVHKVYVYCAGYCQGDWHTSYTSTGGPQSKFSLNTVPVSSQGLAAFYYDPTLTINSTGEGTNFSETWCSKSHTSLATADLTQTTQLVGQLQSASIPANTSRWVKICTFSLYFSGEIRIFNDTPPNRGSCATIRIDFNRSSIPNATTPISITKAGDLSQFAFTGLGLEL
jgi:hypothetical protein